MKPCEYAQVHLDPLQLSLYKLKRDLLSTYKDGQCLKYIIKLKSYPEYANKLNVVDEEYDRKYAEDTNHMVPIGTRARKMKQNRFRT